MNLQLGRAFGIVMKTTPYIFYRAVVYGVICAAFAVLLLFLALVGYVFGSGAAMVMFVIFMVAGGFGARLLREYVLYLLRAGHVAVITEIIERGSLPEGVGQTEWGKQQVTTYFKEVSVLALIDQLVKGIIRALNRTMFNIMQAMPIPGMEGASKVAQKVVDYSLTYIDESILAYTFKTKNENVYGAAQSGIILYCQAWKGLLKNAVALTLLSYAFTVVAALIFLIPLGIIAVLLPEGWAFAKFGLFVLALFMGFSLKWILFDPLACASTILTFLTETEHMTPDPAWEERIESVSDKFRELKQKAAEQMQGASETMKEEAEEKAASMDIPTADTAGQAAPDDASDAPKPDSDNEAGEDPEKDQQ